MNRILKIACILALVGSVSAPVYALQLEVVSRSDNSYGTKPPTDPDDTATLKMNLVDCTEMTEILVDFSITTDDYDTTSDGLYFFLGDNCNTGVADCEQVLEEYSGTTTTVQVSFWQILEDVTVTVFGIDGDDDDLQALCTGAATTNGTYSLWAALLSDEADELSGTWSAAVSLETDLDPPDAPTDIKVQIGDRKAKVGWTKDDIEEYAGAYILSIPTTSSSGDEDAGALQDGGSFSCSGPFAEGDEWDHDNQSISDKRVPKSGGTSSTVQPLVNGVTYQFSVVSYDEFLNDSVLSEVVCGKPWGTVGFFTDYRSAGGTGGGKFCFVATAAFGDYDHPVVKVLRGFRDEFLAPLPGGEALINGYYSVGPAMARVVGESPVLRFGTRSVLTIFAGVAWVLGACGPTGAGLGLCVLLAFVMGLSFSRRRRR
ncbi:MAG: hypothetical protein GY762_18230 [Proteobacteria bacterium]|nr:hypothetical protein [Pseudomonadota bacterium]